MASDTTTVHEIIASIGREDSPVISLDSMKDLTSALASDLCELLIRKRVNSITFHRASSSPKFVEDFKYSCYKLGAKFTVFQTD